MINHLTVVNNKVMSSLFNLILRLSIRSGLCMPSCHEEWQPQLLTFITPLQHMANECTQVFFTQKQYVAKCSSIITCTMLKCLCTANRLFDNCSPSCNVNTTVCNKIVYTSWQVLLSIKQLKQQTTQFGLWQVSCS